jgi:outer membrane protein assembly factor BamA
VKRASIWLSSLALLSWSTFARADAEPEPELEQEPPEPVATPPSPPRDLTTIPDFMRNRQRMGDYVIANKVDGGYFTGLPLINSDPDTGYGFGARVTYFNNGPRADKMFEYTPYRHRLYGQAFFTTNGYQFHTLDYDAPYLDDSPVRLRANIAFEKNVAANYFGVGPSSLGRLEYPGRGRSFSSMSEYTDALRQVTPEGNAFTRYNQYIFQRPSATATLERDFFGGIVRALFGFTASYVDVDQWTGRTVDARAPGASEDTEVQQAPTRLADDCARGIVSGCQGGFNNSLKLGLAFDTRDFEPNPSSGWFIDLTTELAGRPLGSDFDWARVTFSPRVYYSPFPKLTKLVFAGRLVGSVQTADTPIFSMPDLSFTDRNWTGLGGVRTIRGYKQNRFVGRAVALATAELRWTFWEVSPRPRTHLGFMLAPFIDVGRVFDTIDDFELRRFRNGQGVGLRIAWNQATIIILDYGVSREGSTFYVQSVHTF